MMSLLILNFVNYLFALISLYQRQGSFKGRLALCLLNLKSFNKRIGAALAKTDTVNLQPIENVDILSATASSHLVRMPVILVFHPFRQFSHNCHRIRQNVYIHVVTPEHFHERFCQSGAISSALTSEMLTTSSSVAIADSQTWLMNRFYLRARCDVILPGNKRDGIAELHGERNKTVFLFGSIATVLLLASDHFDFLHRTLLKNRSIPMS